jgi:hypothetical protein
LKIRRIEKGAVSGWVRLLAWEVFSSHLHINLKLLTIGLITVRSDETFSRKTFHLAKGYLAKNVPVKVPLVVLPSRVLLPRESNWPPPWTRIPVLLATMVEFETRTTELGE